MNPNTSSEQATIYFRVLKRWWWIPVIFAVLSGSVTYFGTRALMKPVYASSIRMEVISPNSGYTPYGSANDATTDAVLMTTSPVEALAMRHLSADTRRDPGALFGTYCVADANNVFMSCSTQSHDFRAAAGALNDLAAAFVKYNDRAQRSQYQPALARLQAQEKQLRQEISSFRGQLNRLQSGSSHSLGDQYQITALESQLSQDNSSLSNLTAQDSQLQQQISAATSAVHIVDPARPSDYQISPHPARNGALGAFVGLGIAASLIVLLEYLDDSFRSSDEVTMVLGANVLGAVRRFGVKKESSGLVPLTEPRSAVAEQYRVVRTNIEFTGIDRRIKVLLVTSAREGEGKTTTSANLAATIALSGKHVLLVDLDLHRGGLTRAFGLRNQPGLSTTLVSTRDVTPRQTEIPTLHMLPSGPLPPNPAELIGSMRMQEWLDQACHEYDMVVLDAPPVLSVADTRILAARADGTVLVVDPSTSSRRLVKQMRMALEAVGAHVIGVILNKGTFDNDQHYYYQYYYDEYSQDDTAPALNGSSEPAGLEAPSTQ